MCLHVTALLIHTFFMVACQFVTIYTFEHPSPQNSDYLNVSRIAMFTSQSISQAIVIYLFIQFSKPVSISQQDEQASDSDFDEEFDTTRDPNLDMMYYVR